MPTSDRLVAVQIRANRKRQKRRGKKLKKPKVGLLSRVVHLLSTGKLLDFTHQKEADPFWSVLYRQFERLQQLDWHIRALLKNIHLTEEIANELTGLLLLISRAKQELLTYMMNGLEIQYAAVMNSRFYGWKHRYDEFRSAFASLAAENICKLAFDPEKTRPSVYFYQAFWLRGIGITKDISEEISTNREVQDRYKRILRDPQAKSPDDEVTAVPHVEGDLAEGLEQINSVPEEQTEENVDITFLFETLQDDSTEDREKVQRLIAKICEITKTPIDLLYEIKTAKDLQSLAVHIRKVLREKNLFEELQKEAREL